MIIRAAAIFDREFEIHRDLKIRTSKQLDHLEPWKGINYTICGNSIIPISNSLSTTEYSMNRKIEVKQQKTHELRQHSRSVATPAPSPPNSNLVTISSAEYYKPDL